MLDGRPRIQHAGVGRSPTLRADVVPCGCAQAPMKVAHAGRARAALDGSLPFYERI